MTESEAVQTLALVNKLWPKTSSAWAPELATEFMVSCERVPISFDQADAAIKALAMRTKFATVKPVECLEALKNAVNRVTEERRSATMNVPASSVEAAANERLKDLPAHLRHEVLLRIDWSLPEPESRGALADNLATAASMAENGNWVGALDWPLFRHEVKECPEVRRWLASASN